MNLDIKEEYDNIKSTLDNAIGWGDISGGARKEVQEKFSFYLNIIRQQQETIADYENLYVIPDALDKLNKTENGTQIEVQYEDILNTIIDGIIRHNEPEIVGKMLTNRSISMYDLDDRVELKRRVRLYVSQDAYGILVHLKKHLGKNLRVMEENEEIMTEHN